MAELRSTIRRMALWQKVVIGAVIIVVAALITKVLADSPTLGAILAAIALIAINPPRPSRRNPNSER